MLDIRLSHVLELLPDPAIVLREDREIVFANRLAENLLGYAEGELLGQPLETIVPEPCWDQYAEGSADPFAVPPRQRMASRLSLSALCKDGRELPVEISFSPLETAEGLLLVASLRDTSAQRQVESDLRSALANVERLRDRLAAENVYLREETQRAGGHEKIVGKGRALRFLLQQIEQVAETDATVLILGETGTGKELVARAIHAHSRRKDRPLIVMNCAALTSSLIESELFGHEAGAFTGALARKIGRFELADGGTIFLDEIGELPLELQAKLLRVIQEGFFWRLGSGQPTQVDVRVIAATNHNLQRAMVENKFRSDLYFRLAVFPIETPPLRARREDIPLLVWHFISQKQAKLGKRIEQISSATMDHLAAYPWPGNIRELENVLERALIISTGSTLLVEPLLDAVEPYLAEAPRRGTAAAPSGVINDVVREHILSVLDQCSWRIKGTGAAAERLGIKPSTLRYRMKTLGIERPKFHDHRSLGELPGPRDGLQRIN